MKSVEYDPAVSYKYVQPKFDGIMIVCCNGICSSRAGNRLPWKAPRGVNVLGELYVPGERASAVKSSLAHGIDNLRAVYFAVLDLPYQAPLEDVNAVLEYHGLEYAPLLHNPSWPPPNPDWEGYMYKNGNMLDWAKRKPVKTADLLCTDVTVGNGKFAGQVGSLVCVWADGTPAANVSGFDDATRLLFTEQAPIGQIIEVAYQYVGSQGGLRHPRFVSVRKDKTHADQQARHTH